MSPLVQEISRLREENSLLRMMVSACQSGEGKPEVRGLQCETTSYEPKEQNYIEEIERLCKELQGKEKAIQERDKKIEDLETNISSLKRQLEWFLKKMFGKMSEKKLPTDPTVLQPTLFDMLLPEEEQAALDAEVKAMEEQNAKIIEVKSHKREVRKPVMSKDLPIELNHVYPDGVNRDEYYEIDPEITDTLAIRPPVMYIKRTIRHKFVLKSNLQIKYPDRQAFLIGPLPETIIPKGMASESLLADILINKYVYHLPFYRVIQKYKELGVQLSASTIGDWFASVCTRLRPLYDKLREKIMASDYIQVDESTLPVVDNEKHRAVKGYIWVVRDAVCGDVYFHYDMGSRSGETAQKLIGSYRGAIQTDGYEVYNAYENVAGKLMIGCWAHARRKFVEALDEDKKHASEALVYIGKLYKIEQEMKEAGLDYDAIKKRREEESYKIILKFEEWMTSVSSLFSPKSRMGKAILYTYALRHRLGRYVLDGRYQIDSNLIENSIRSLAIGRKNFLFCGNHEAAVRAAIVYSLFGSCKAHGIDVRKWLEDTLTRIPTEKDVEKLLPSPNWQPSPKQLTNTETVNKTDTDTKN